ncbi:MAG TPA: protein translocase subunit SecD [Streptosporangiaceae bacterium]|nr:protein translocase subunit SecD [Streptosporangiaceae bacterium]
MAPASGKASRPGTYLAVLVALIVALFLAVVGGSVVHPGNWGKDFRVHLGLDLTSGTTVALKAQTLSGGAPNSSSMKQALQIMQNRVNGAGFTEAQVQQQGSNVITVAVPGQNSQRVVNIVGQTALLLFRQVLLEAPNKPVASTTPTPTPSPSGSSSSSPSASPSPSTSSKASTSSSPHAAGLPGSAAAGGAREMANRARSLTAASATPSASASSSPGGSSSAAATPSASPSASPASTSSTGTSTVADATGNASLVSPQVRALFDKLNCSDKTWKQQVGYNKHQYDNANIQTVGCGSNNGVPYKYVLDKAHVLGTMVHTASATLAQNSATAWQVNLNFNGQGTTLFGNLTSQMFSKYGATVNTSPTSATLDTLAIVLDGNVISPSTIQSAIPGGQAQITGNFTQQQATNLATVLNYGALPLTFTKQSVQSVTPQLGNDQLRAGLIAGAIGLLLVVLFCLLYYRGLAIVAVSSLAIAALLTFEAVVMLGKYQGYALSLAGVAGLIVAIGITADSFVVFFERLRDEVREGRTLRTAVERGWRRARRTILVSDTVSFLAAALLWYFAIGDVKGFAFTLGLTTLIDVVVVFLFTKPMITLLARTKFYGRGHRLSGLDPARLGARAPWRSSARTPRVRTRTTTPAKES